MLHTLFTLVGPSGAGKTTLINNVVERVHGLHIIKTTTSRERRGPSDDRHYNFAGKQLIDTMYEQGKILQLEHYADNYYCTQKKYVFELLEDNDCINALTEHGVQQFLAAGVPVKAIYIQPVGAPAVRPDRAKHDAERTRVMVTLNHTIRNNFTKTDGLESAVKELISYIEKNRKYSTSRSNLLTMPPGSVKAAK